MATKTLRKTIELPSGEMLDVQPILALIFEFFNIQGGRSLQEMTDASSTLKKTYKSWRTMASEKYISDIIDRIVFPNNRKIYGVFVRLNKELLPYGYKFEKNTWSGKYELIKM